MPVVMLSNACTPLGQVNGATCTAVGIARNGPNWWSSLLFTQDFAFTNSPPLAGFFEFGDLYVMCTNLLPACYSNSTIQNSRLWILRTGRLRNACFSAQEIHQLERILDSTATSSTVSRILFNTVQSARIKLQSEMERLQELEKGTLLAWDQPSRTSM